MSCDVIVTEPMWSSQDVPTVTSRCSLVCT